MMFDKNVILILVLVLLIFIMWNSQTPVIEGLDLFKKLGIKKTIKSIEKEAGKTIKKLGGDNKKSSSTKATAAATAATAATAAAATEATEATAEPTVQPPVVTSEPPSIVEAPSSVEVAAQPPLPQDFKEVQVYLDKLKTYSTDAQKMSDTINTTAENYKKAYDEATSNLTKLSELATSKAVMAETAASKADDLLKDITMKATDIQAQVNSNNIVKNEIAAKINEFRDIDKNVSDKSIETSMNANNAKGSAEEARRTLASILPTAANNTVLQNVKVEGFTGFKTSVLEGYTPFTTPSNNKNAFDLENDLVSKINLFNTAYYGFLSGTKSQTELNTANAALTTSITNLQNYINANINKDPKISDVEFKTRHTALKTTSDQINSLRADLDMKMNEIIKAKEGVPMDYTIERDTAAYTTILWTALATSMLYLVFVKMD